jgi:hypothetical protein
MNEKDRIVLHKIKKYIVEALAYIREMDYDSLDNGLFLNYKYTY